MKNQYLFNKLSSVPSEEVEKRDYNKTIRGFVLIISLCLYCFICLKMFSRKAPYQKLMQVQDEEKNYLQVSALKSFKQLPICMLVLSSVLKEESKGNIYNQKYSNYHIVILSNNSSAQLNAKTAFWNEQTENYFSFSKIVSQHCKQRQLVFIVRQGLKDEQILNKLNDKFQTFQIWTSFTLCKQNQRLYLHAFYRQILFKLQTNDFYSQYQERLAKKNNFYALTLGIYYLSLKYLSLIEFSQLFIEKKERSENVLSAFIGSLTLKSLINYQTMFYLSQQYQIDQETIYQRQRRRKVADIEKGRAAITNKQLTRFYFIKNNLDLPENHTVNELERIYFEEKYYLKMFQKELPMCIVIPSHNNIPHHRYKRILKSIFIQNYKNYHIVLIDDLSTDQTLNESIKYTKQYGFPQDRIQFVRNQKQMFATYNIYNAANNYCKKQQIFVLLDGDDEVVGRQVFRLLNSFYLKEKQYSNWVVYTNYYFSTQHIGRSWEVQDTYFTDPSLFRSSQKHFFGMIRSFITQLFLKIKLEDHKDKNGKFFDIAYDEALQQPLFELAGRHIEYIPEICYFYNKERNNFGNSDVEKQERIQRVNEDILSRQRYSPLNKLFD